MIALLPGGVAADPRAWQREWPDTDFSRSSVDFDEIVSGGPPKDGIPSIDDPAFVPLEEAHLLARGPVIGLVVGDEAKAYPLRILMWHEIVNHEIAGVPVAVTCCPLCDTSIVFDRRVRERGTIEAGDLRLTCEPGQASALDRSVIAEGQVVGNAVVRRRTRDGVEDVVYSVAFAFAFQAFYPGATIHTRWPPP